MSARQSTRWLAPVLGAFVLLSCTMLSAAQVRQLEGEISSNTFIVGGASVSVSQFPYVAYLISSTGRGGSTSSCTGSLIQNSPVPVVLTAAHCGANNDGFTMRRAYVGAQTISQLCKSQPTCRQMNVRTIIRNPGYQVANAETVDETGHDAALWVLTPFNETRPITDIPPVVINTNPNVPAANAPSNAVGWGLTNSGAQTSATTLQGVTLFATNNFNCEWYFGLSAANRPRLGCIIGGKNVQGQQTSVCQGDSGGPHIVNGVQWGVTSFGPNPCDKANTPAVVTRVSGIADWIQSTLADINAGRI